MSSGAACNPTSMTASSRVRCPAYGFTVFNRRIAACESCKAPLPANLMFTGKELARLEEEAARIAKIRADMARETERLEEERQRRQGDGG